MEPKTGRFFKNGELYGCGRGLRPTMPIEVVPAEYALDISIL
jgi:hypothetical protein